MECGQQKFDEGLVCWIDTGTSKRERAVIACKRLSYQHTRQLHQSAWKRSVLKLIVPTVTWWNSFHDVYAPIVEMPLADINSLCTQLQIKCMNDREYQFLKEYCSIVLPFTIALDILQGEDICFYGTL